MQTAHQPRLCMPSDAGRGWSRSPFNRQSRGTDRGPGPGSKVCIDSTLSPLTVSSTYGKTRRSEQRLKRDATSLYLELARQLCAFVAVINSMANAAIEEQ